MTKYTFRDIGEKAAAMREFRKLRDAGLPIPQEVRDRHVRATNDGYATGPDPGELVPDFALSDQSGSTRSLKDSPETLYRSVTQSAE
jgi:hypothetical protein